MVSGRLRHSVRARLVGLLLAITLAPLLLGAGRPHRGSCAAHAVPAAAAGEHAGGAQGSGHPHHAGGAVPTVPLPGGPALAAQADCTHCPASVCVAISSCTGQAPALTDARGPDLAPRHRATGAGPVWLPAFSRTGPPPTPPPSALL